MVIRDKFCSFIIHLMMKKSRCNGKTKKGEKKKAERDRERGIIELVCYFFAALIILWRKEQWVIILFCLVCIIIGCLGGK